MKSFVLGLLLGLAVMLTLSGTARSADNGLYQIVPISESMRQFINTHEDWVMCGDYFAIVETAVDNTLYFNYRVKPDEKPGFDFGPISQIFFTIHDGISTPMLGIFREKFYIAVNGKDYVAGLPCLAQGLRIGI